MRSTRTTIVLKPSKKHRGCRARDSAERCDDSGLDGTKKKLAWFAWIAVCLIWGTTYLGIRISLETMPPMLMGGLRWTVAGGALAAYMWIRGGSLPAPRSGVLRCLDSDARARQRRRGVGRALRTERSHAMVVASSPFWMAGVEALYRVLERLTWNTMLGLLVGFSGIVLLIWPELLHGGATGRSFVLGMVALQVACLGWAIGSSCSMARRHENVFSVLAAQMLAGGAMMLLTGTLRGEWGSLDSPCNHHRIRLPLDNRRDRRLRRLHVRAAPARFAGVALAYINPIIAVALGVAVLGEPLPHAWRSPPRWCSAAWPSCAGRVRPCGR